MIKSFLLAIAALLILEGTAIAQTKDERAVAAAAAALNKAILDADKSALEALTSTALSYGHSGGQVDDQAQFITPLINGTIDFTSIETGDQTIRITGKTAIVRNTFNGNLTKDGKNITLKIGILMVWENVKGNWKLLARQGYKL